MRLLGRLRGGLKGIQAALLTPAADPRQEFASVYERQLVLLAQVRRALDELRVHKARLAESTAEVEGKLPRLALRARHALEGGSEESARLALERHAMAEAEVAALTEHSRAMEEEEKRLTVLEQRVAAQIETLATQQTLLAARSTTAQTQLRLREQLMAVSGKLGELGAALEATEQRARTMKARAAAVDELVESGLVGGQGHIGGSCSGRWLQYQVQERLAELKAELAAREGRAAEGRDGQRERPAA